MRTIAYITDIHLDEDFTLQHGVNAEENWQLIMEDVRRRNINEIIFGGDIGGVAAYPSFFESLKDFSLHLTPGNHDKSAEVLKHYRPAALKSTSAVYSSEVDESFKYIFLDSSKEQIDDEQYRFLISELQTDKRILIFIHHPILSVDTPVDRLYPLIGREKIVSELQNMNNEILVFSGHYHVADKRSNRNITQFVTPAASFQIVKDEASLQIHNKYFGYRIISIDDVRVNTEILIYQSGSFNSMASLENNKS
jgi:3',5'-cyclic-AMP phosphodiesterase